MNMVSIISKFRFFHLLLIVVIFATIIKILPTNQNSENKYYVLGIDIDGTKINAQLFGIENSFISEVPAWGIKQPTEKGLAEHVNQIAELFTIAEKQANKMSGDIIALGIGSPGRFDEFGNIKPGTSPHLGKTLNEFDNVNLKAEYLKALNSKKSFNKDLHVQNDGNAMLAGILESIRKENIQNLVNQNGNQILKNNLQNKHIALFGIGTGIGHAIAKTSNSSEFKFITDGHASKLRVQVDDKDLPLPQATKQSMEQISGKEEIVILDNNMVRAEDLFRGPVIYSLANIKNGQEVDFTSEKFNQALRFAGKYMARTIALIKSGISEDVEPKNGWTNLDKQEAAKTSIYLIGGGVGSSTIGKMIINFAADELKKLNITDIDLIQIIEENSPERAAATLVPESIYSHLAKEKY